MLAARRMMLSRKVGTPFSDNFNRNPAVTDTFDRADQTPLGTTSDGTATWTTQQATWSIASNRAQVNAAGVATIPGTADGQVEFEDQNNVSGAAVVFRFSNISNYWRLLRNTSSTVQLQKIVAGAATNVGSSFSSGRYSILTVRFSGSAITVYRNGVSQVTATDSFNSTATLVGLGSNTGGVTMENFNYTSSTTTAPRVPTLGSPWITWSDSPVAGFQTSLWNVFQTSGSFVAHPVQDVGSGSATDDAMVYPGKDGSDGTMHFTVTNVPGVGSPKVLAIFRADVDQATPANRSCWVLGAGALYYLAAGSTTYTSVATWITAIANGDVIDIILSGSSITVKKNTSTTLCTVTDSRNATMEAHGPASNSVGTSTNTWVDDYSWTPA